MVGSSSPFLLVHRSPGLNGPVGRPTKPHRLNFLEKKGGSVREDKSRSKDVGTPVFVFVHTNTKM